MEQPGDGGIFLLKVLVDKISFVNSPCFSDKDFRTCVTITASAVEPIEICDDDPGACAAKSAGPFVKTFNNGKSCMFTLPEAEITKAMNSFPVYVTVHKSLPCGCLPPKIIMGTATIDLTKKFVESRNKYLEDPMSVNCQALKDTFQIVAGEGKHVGDIVMFLRISCFGKLIITRCQGASQSNLGASRAAIVDRSCNPHRMFQTTEDPCVCDATRVGGVGKGVPGTGPPCQHGGGHGGGPCPITQDPCQDGICYCSGPSPPLKHPMVCRYMDQYCLHVPKGVLPSLPIYQDLTEEQILEIKSTYKDLKLLHLENHFFSSSSASSSIPYSETATVVDEHSQLFTDSGFSAESSQVKLDHSATSLYDIISKKRSVSFSDKVDYASKSYNHYLNYRKNYSSEVPEGIFGKKVTTVYVMLFDDLCRRHTSGTQATAAVNKCLQASQSQASTNNNKYDHFVCRETGGSSRLVTSQLCSRNQSAQKKKYSDIYFFGKKKSDQKHKNEQGMGTKSVVKTMTNSNTSSPLPERSQASVLVPTKVQSTVAAVQAQPDTASVQCYTTCRTRSVCIKERPCPGAVPGIKGDVVATISHIKIGPREQCPVHGKEPCQGPKCIVAASGVNADNQAAVKVTTVTNPRQGVFELVIRKLTGAPLARNELMLEWTPPTCRPPTCGSPSLTPCMLSGPGCRPSKCKMVVCRSSPCRSTKCFKPPCRKCCRTTCSGKLCRPCKPCRPCVPASMLCRPCPPSPRCRPCPLPPRCRPCPPPPRCRPCLPPPRCRPCLPPPRCRPCLPPPRCRPCPPPPRCRPCPPPPRCRPCPPSLRCWPCLPSLRCRPCSPPPRCRPCPPPPRCRPCPPPPRCRPCPPPPRCRPCSPPRRCRPCSPCPPSPLCTPCPPSPQCRACCPPPRCRPSRRCSPLRRCSPCSPPPQCRPCPPSPRCRPCPPSPRCRPCPPKPCNAPCASPPSTSPCKSSSCLRPCPVGYRKRRKVRCQPKIRPHRNLISPCLNRSKACPVVRCRSVPSPCVGCCGAPPCKPKKCCSIFPWKPRKCPVYVCGIRKCGLSCLPAPCSPAPCSPAVCSPLPCPALPCAPLPCQLMPRPSQKCCSKSRYKIKNCCKKGCSDCCT